MLIKNVASKGNVVGNYRPTACLNLIWKLLTGIIAEKLFDHLDKQTLLPDEQKGGRGRSRGKKDQPLVNKAAISNIKQKRI